MLGILIQYILVVILVVVLAYLIYFLKKKDIIAEDDYYGIAYTILGELGERKSSAENVKFILRKIYNAVQDVEVNMKHEDNYKKEEKALAIVKISMYKGELPSTLSDEHIRYLIRLACALNSSTNKREL